MTSTSFYPSTAMKSRMMACCERDTDGRVRIQAEPTMGREMDASKVGPFLSGGGGLFGTAKDYLALLRAILRSSPDNAATDPLISEESFKTLFAHALPLDRPDQPNDSLTWLAVMAEEQNIHDPAILTEGSGKHIAHSVGLFINLIDSKYGRKAGSGCWDGAAKTYWFMDSVTGIAVRVMTV
jgi:methyl acetate hydrolase